jgi:hypothetical protein
MRSYDGVEIGWKPVFNYAKSFVPDFVKSLWKKSMDVEEDCPTISTCFHIVVYSFNNCVYICSMVACLLRKPNRESVHYYGDRWK